MVDEESSDNEEKRWKLFVTKPGQVPCLRQSFLTGILSGLGIGVAYFFKSSNVRHSTHVGFGSYVVVTLGTWFYCRYSLAQQRFQQRRLKKALQAKIASEGTDSPLQDI